MVRFASVLALAASFAPGLTTELPRSAGEELGSLMQLTNIKDAEGRRVATDASKEASEASAPSPTPVLGRSHSSSPSPTSSPTPTPASIAYAIANSMADSAAAPTPSPTPVELTVMSNDGSNDTVMRSREDSLAKGELPWFDGDNAQVLKPSTGLAQADKQHLEKRWSNELNGKSDFAQMEAEHSREVKSDERKLFAIQMSSELRPIGDQPKERESNEQGGTGKPDMGLLQTGSEHASPDESDKWTVAVALQTNGETDEMDDEEGETDELDRDEDETGELDTKLTEVDSAHEDAHPEEGESDELSGDSGLVQTNVAHPEEGTQPEGGDVTKTMLIDIKNTILKSKAIEIDTVRKLAADLVTHSKKTVQGVTEYFSAYFH